MVMTHLVTHIWALVPHCVWETNYAIFVAFYMLYFPSIFLFFSSGLHLILFDVHVNVSFSIAHYCVKCCSFKVYLHRIWYKHFYAEKLNHLSLYFLFVSINIIDDHISIKLLHNYPDPRQNVVPRSAESFKKVEDGIIHPFPNFIGCPMGMDQ